MINGNSGKALDVANASTADGAIVIQGPVTGGSNQDWQVVSL
ncbi:RICIN domain-containing protein [Streptomyces sp. HUAS ZL42]